MELTFQDLLDRPQIERHITLSCVSNPVGGDLVGNALWQGVRLADILDEAGLQDGAEQVVSRSIDGWTCGSPIEAIMDGRDAMLAIAMNGEPLPADHGYPVRIVVPGLFGYVSATKWVTDIRLTRWEDFDAYWVPRGWSKRGPVKTMARIDTPRSGAKRDGVVAIGGVAWAVHRGVEAVEVRIDEGDWQEAELGSVPSADTWVQWVYRWDTSDVERGRPHHRGACDRRRRRPATRGTRRRSLPTAPRATTASPSTSADSGRIARSLRCAGSSLPDVTFVAVRLGLGRSDPESAGRIQVGLWLVPGRVGDTGGRTVGAVRIVGVGGCDWGSPRMLACRGVRVRRLRIARHARSTLQEPARCACRSATTPAATSTDFLFGPWIVVYADGSFCP